ncbi:MAG: cupin domain-containing protein [Sphingobacterium sp.]|jgi:mannose-6-phosphate isomerase-like protein (cupin superfamily)|uniref:cupin domain-containing protein n=1 Tax=Sphingobacterium sp. TaxID=341027 RepID=UPI00284BC29A|nr:cupin domain-containing protein [Sphingobacterium sp.]MDR3008186.1 cupin domain-containing protein [Sphingobacterium sp.]
MTIKNTDNSEHYIWGENCDGWHLLKSDSLSVIQEKMPPGTKESLHFHSKAQQFFYILKGTATFEVDNQLYVVEENSGFHIQASQKHRIFNRTNQDLEFLVISQPKSHGDRINL